MFCGLQNSQNKLRHDILFKELLVSLEKVCIIFGELYLLMWPFWGRQHHQVFEKKLNNNVGWKRQKAPSFSRKNLLVPWGIARKRWGRKTKLEARLEFWSSEVQRKAASSVWRPGQAQGPWISLIAKMSGDIISPQGNEIVHLCWVLATLCVLTILKGTMCQGRCFTVDRLSNIVIPTADLKLCVLSENMHLFQLYRWINCEYRWI